VFAAIKNVIHKRITDVNATSRLRWWTVPFDPFDPDYRRQHSEDHGHEFGARTEAEYEAMADHFMTKPMEDTMEQCLRKPYCHIRCRYDKRSQEYGTMYLTGNLITYFIADPEIHGWTTNLQYFWHRCEGGQ
jgi:pyocin large subunit-like protein